MKKMKLGLLPKLILGIIGGICIGLTQIHMLTQVLVTFSGLFGNFLVFAIPLLIIGFIVPGIAELGEKAGKLLGLTAGLAYLSTVLAGVFAFVVATAVIPHIIGDSTEFMATNLSVEPIFTIEIPPVMGVMTALVLAFILGLGISAVKGRSMLPVMQEFQEIIKRVIEKVIIPFLPFHIAGIFAEMAYSGTIASKITVFGSVFLLVIATHYAYILLQYTVAAIAAKMNPFSAIKKMLPAYMTAIGTQSSAATIPVSLKSIRSLNKVTEEVAEFVAPLGAAIHLSGSTISITMCAIAVMTLNGMTLEFGQVVLFIMMLGVTMVAAPGVPGGAVMAALGLLELHLGFTEMHLGLMMALYMAQDSFGTAANVMGDGAVAILVSKSSKTTKQQKGNHKLKQATT